MPYEEVDRAIRSQFGSKLNGGSGVIKTFAHNISYTRGGSIRVLLGVYKQMSIEDVSVTAWYAFDDNQRLVRITVKKYVDSL